MDPVVLVAVCGAVHLNLRLDDRVVFDPARSSKAIRCRLVAGEWRCREMTSTGAVLGAIADNVLIPITECPSLPDLAVAVGFDWKPAPPRPPIEPLRSPLRLI